MQDRNIREYMTTVKCSVCGEYYQFDNVSIVGHQDEVWLLSVFCTGCQTRGLVAAMVKESKSGRSKKAAAKQEQLVPVEPLPEDADAAVPIGMDDVLDIHNFLRHFDGDFLKLFGGS